MAAAIASLLVVAGYHPCEGLGPLVILPVLCAGIAVLACLPNVTARALLLPGLAAVTVVAFAIGLDYSNSGAVSPTGAQCEPVPGFAGFLLALGLSGFIAAIGPLAVMLLVAMAHGVWHWRSGNLKGLDAESGEG